MIENNKIIEVIISVGKTLSINDEYLSMFSGLSENNLVSKIHQEHLNQKNYNTNLSNEDLIHVFRGLVIIGNHLNWQNSDAEAIFIYRVIMERKLDSDLKIANWAFLNSRNPFIPFGSAGNIRQNSRDAYDYVRNSGMQFYLHLNQEVKEKINGYSSYLDQRTIKELEVKIDTLLRKVSDLEGEIERLKTEKENLKIRLLLTEKTNIEKAEFIIDDLSRPIYFYFKEIEQIIVDKKVHKNLLIKIHDKFKFDENSYNKPLKIKIMNEINNR